MRPFPNLSPIGTVTKISVFWLTIVSSPIYRLSNAGQRAAALLLKPSGWCTRGSGKTVPPASSAPRIRKCGRYTHRQPGSETGAFTHGALHRHGTLVQL